MASPPTSDPGPDPSDAPGTPLRAVLTGVGIDICASKLIGTVVFTVYMMSISTPGMTTEQLRDALQRNPPGLLLHFVYVSLVCAVSVFAGFASARIVQRAEFRVGAVTAIAAVLVDQVIDGGGSDDTMTLLSIACDLSCVMLGVKYGAESNRRRESPAASPADASSP